jgi:hypothetical protein
VPGSEQPPIERRERVRFIALGAFVVFLAFTLRAIYVLSANVQYPIRGDINQYTLYAWNLTHRGVFSTSMPNTEPPVPDSFRGPGYPVMLAVMMTVAGHSDLPLRPGPEGTVALGYDTDTWMRLALALQVMLGTATVWLTIVLARFWLGRWWSLGAGLLVALWPHMISFTGVLLSETLLGFMVVLALCLACASVRKFSVRTMALAGLAFGLTYLVNPIVLLYVPALATMLTARSQRKLAVALMLSFLVLPAGWALRNSIGVTGSGAVERMKAALVEGSWPQCHLAESTRLTNPISQQIVQAIDAEMTVMDSSWSAGFASIFGRMRQDPPYYLSWYLYEKPFSLWDWKIHIGTGDIYFLPTAQSPFDKIPLLGFIEQTFRRLNTAFFLLAAATALWLLPGILLPSRRTDFPPILVASFALYVTALYTALDAEPRYSIPFRPEEVLMLLTAVSWLCEALGRRLRRAMIANESR